MGERDGKCGGNEIKRSTASIALRKDRKSNIKKMPKIEKAANERDAFESK